jgi:2-aminoadipate transaminase
MNLEALYSRMAREAKPSIIRALLKLVQNSEIISFAGGTPDADLFPLEAIAEISRKVILEEGRLSLQYGETQGWKPLREALAVYLEAKGIKAGADEILITNGSQQGIDLLARVLLDPGDGVALENPAYLGALIAFKNFGAEIIPLDMDADGLKPEALEEAVRSGKKPKLLYLTPSFQNPSGRLLTEERRKRVAALCAGHGILIAEDDPYGEINFGAPFKPLKAFDPAGCTAYFGSFSKIGSPGMRLGWVAAPKDLIAKMVLVKETSDVCTNVLSQAIAAEFIKSGMLGPHIKKLIGTYRGRALTLLESLRKEMGQAIELEEPKGGFFLWGKLKGGQDAEALFQSAIDQGVAYVPGSAFYPRPGEGKDTLRLTFCAVGEEKIREGVKRLARVMKPLNVGAR